MAMSTRLPRWTWLLVLPMLVGGLLVMHGLDIHPGVSRPAEAAVSNSAVAEHSHHGSTPVDHGHCVDVDCLVTHAMAACVAIVTVLGGVGLIRRRVSRRDRVAPTAMSAGRIRAVVELARQPEPVWIRLSVMRC